MTGLRKPGEADQVWAEAAGALGGAASVAEGDEQGRSSAWPIVMFMSLVMGGPYLIWKLLRSVQSSLGDSATSSPQGELSRSSSLLCGKSITSNKSYLILNVCLQQ